MNQLELYYWCGFLLADGYFLYQKDALARITLALAIKDKSHILRFKEFFGTGSYSEYFVKKKYLTCKVILSKKYFQQITKILNFNLHRKTYNPISLDQIKGTQEERLSFVLGFIDADGYILHQSKRKDYFLGINLHKSWASFLEDIKLFLSNSFELINSNIQFYKNASRFVISNTNVILNLKTKAVELDIPILTRKWDKVIKLYKKSERAKDDLKTISSLRDSGLTYSKISEITGFTMSKINYFLRKRRQCI